VVELHQPSPSIGVRLRPELPGILLGCACLCATNALALAVPWLIKSAIDALRTLPAAVAHGRVVRDAIAIIACAVLQAAIRTWSRVLIFNAGRNIEYGLRRDLFGHLCRLDPGFYRRHPTGDVMSRLTNDLGAVRMLFGPGLLNLFNTAFVYATTLTLLVRLSPQLTLWALLPYPILLAGARVFTRKMYRASRAIAEQLGTLSAAIQEDLAGIGVIKHYALEPERQAAFRTLNDEYLRRSLAMVRARGGLMPLFAGLGGLGTLVVLWAGGREVIAGRLSIGGLVAFNAYLVLLSWPTVALGWIIGIWQRGVASWVRVKELLSERSSVEDRVEDPAGATVADASATEAAPAIEARDLAITVDGRKLLDGVSFALPAGGTLAIVGPTGSGKTTLVDAILRMQDVAPGALRVGGEDVTALPLERLRTLTGYAPQDAFLFSATVAENIGFGRRGPADAERVRWAAEAAGLGPDIAVLPEGYETLVGERGITLSGGQRQRVALARALAADPRILILDDSLSSVDAQTEREILTRLRPILAGRTSVLVSHRVAAVKDADRILVLDGGRVAEQGTHDELLARGGLYASLYREQLAAEALAGGQS
jgi:ATP-binding cassette subfamily B protein